MAKRKNSKGKALALLEKGSTLEQLAKENGLSKADLAILHEVALNRRAIVKLAQIALDHERRLNDLEEAVGELAGEEEPIDIEAEKEDEDEDED